jgi:hypothetical protein
MNADVAAAVAAYQQTGSKAAAARLLGIPTTTLKDRLAAAERPQASIKGRKTLDVENGSVIIFSDAHYWPGEPSTAHRALLHLLNGGIPLGAIKPVAVVCNGDAIDGSAISRHPPIGWESCPSVKEELEVCQERLGEISNAVSSNSPGGVDVAKFWLLGNHDARFETRLAQVAPEFRDVHGIHLHDHFPDWQCGWSLFINGDVVIKHRIGGGAHAAYGNTIKSGLSTVTGHLHSQKVSPFTDYRGTRYGVDTGCLADPYHPAFQGYLEDNPRDWRSGFCVLTFYNGSLLAPELVTVFDETHVQFRGAIHEV